MTDNTELLPCLTEYPRKAYRRLLKKLCRREMRKIEKVYPHSLEDLSNWHSYMMISCINEETPAQERFLGIAILSANAIDELRELKNLEHQNQ